MISEFCPLGSELGSFRGLARFPRCGAALGAQLLQLCVFGLGSDENGNVRVRVFAQDRVFSTGPWISFQHFR
jgi:hypothetical protein